MKRKFNIPIYDFVLWVVISDDIVKEREKMDEVFGVGDYDEFAAFVSYYNGYFGIFLTPDATRNTIAHEIYHLTRRMCGYHHCDYGAAYHEHEALLCGYLTDLVYGVIDKNEQSKNTTRKDKK